MKNVFKQTMEKIRYTQKELVNKGISKFSNNHATSVILNDTFLAENNTNQGYMFSVLEFFNFSILRIFDF